MRVQVAAIDAAGRDRVVVRLAGGQRIPISRDASLRLRLAPGAFVDEDALRALAAEDAAVSAALRLLALRARTRDDLRRRLARRFPEAAVCAAMARVSAYLDDESFARQWVEARLARRPQGRAALLAELRRQGVDGPAAEAAVAGLDEAALIDAAAAAVLRRLRDQPPEVVRRRLAAALARRGFSASAIRRVLGQRAGGEPQSSWRRETAAEEDI